MRILDRYIIKSVVVTFVACLAAFIFLYVITDLFSRLDELLRQRIDIEIVLRYYTGFLPVIFVQVSPVACLLATLYTFARLNRDNEIIAMRASGLSIPQITRTTVIFGILVSLFVFWVNDKFVPDASSFTQKLEKQMEQKGTQGPKARETLRDIYLYGIKNRLFYIKQFTPYNNTLEGITILEHDQEQNVTKKIIANKGVYKDGLWRFYQSITYYFDKNGQIKQEPQYFEEEIMAIPETPQEFMTQRQHPEFMTIAQLDDYIWKLSKSGAKTVVRNLKIDLYRRFTDPLTNIMIILLGIPFAMMIRKRAAGLSSLGVSIMLGFLYYVLNAIAIAFGKSGFLTPVLAVSLSHITAFLTSLYLISNLP
jgi:lipopolysaccharide export system permease protein